MNTCNKFCTDKYICLFQFTKENLAKVDFEVQWQYAFLFIYVEAQIVNSYANSRSLVFIRQTIHANNELHDVSE
jgi:hypothetical protein